jgi:hypothetical protein
MYAGVCPECFYTHVSDRRKDWEPNCTECGTLRFPCSAKSADQLIAQIRRRVGKGANKKVMKRRVEEAVRKYDDNFELRHLGFLEHNRYTGPSYVPSHMELKGRLETPIVGFVCGSCGWVLIEAGRPRRKACPVSVCGVEHMRTHGGDGFDEMSKSLISNEVAHPDPIGGEVYIKGRVANALERFNGRKDDWSLAEKIAVGEGATSRGWIFNIYKGISRRSHIRRRKEERTRSRRNKKKTSSAVGEARAGLAKNKKRFDKKKGGRVFGESLGKFRKKKK